MEEQLINFETAKLAKEKGFKIPTKVMYKGNEKSYGHNNEWGIDEKRLDGEFPYTNQQWYSIPAQSVLQKWLREKYDIEINITRMPPEAIKSSFNKGNKRIKKYNMWVWNLNGNPRIENSSLFFDNYEEALEAGLQEALKLI